MAKSDDERIRQKAHELWEAEGRPHGREEDHWVQAREIIAIQDSQRDTLMPADTGEGLTVEEPEEALRNLADFPNLTDQGENLLTSTDREPTFESAQPDGDMPDVEVPVSDQPGIPAAGKGKVGATKVPAAKSGDTTKAKPAEKKDAKASPDPKKPSGKKGGKK